MHDLQVAGPNTVQYDTSKAAVAGLTRSMARDHAKDGIRVNAVCPGPTYSRFHEKRAADSGDNLLPASLRRALAATRVQMGGYGLGRAARGGRAQRG